MNLDKFKKKIEEKNRNLFVTIDDPISSKQMKFSISNNITLWRAQTLYTKEITTIQWIRDFFIAHAIFLKCFFHDSKLPTAFIHHLVRGTANCVHRKSTEDECEHHAVFLSCEITQELTQLVLVPVQLELDTGIELRLAIHRSTLARLALLDPQKPLYTGPSE